MPDRPLISSHAWCQPGPVPDKLPPKRLRGCPRGPAHTPALSLPSVPAFLSSPHSVFLKMHEMLIPVKLPDEYKALPPFFLAQISPS